MPSFDYFLYSLYIDRAFVSTGPSLRSAYYELIPGLAIIIYGRISDGLGPHRFGWSATEAIVFVGLFDLFS